MTQKQMIAVAKDEIRIWNKLPHGLVLAILWAFIHRISTGYTVEESFFSKEPTEQPIDFQI